MSDQRKSLVVPLIVAAVAAVALVAMWRASADEPAGTDSTAASSADTGASPDSDAGADTEAEKAKAALTALARRDADDPMAKGDPDAPVVMIAYSEFQCPFCGKFARDTAPGLEEKYVEDGTLRIEWRDFPYLGPESTTAAQAGRAAAAQGRFWEFHDALYADQPAPNSGNLDQAFLDSIAEDIGLDVEEFRSDMSSPETERAVQADFSEGQRIGVTGTPAFIINGVPVIGAQPTATFEHAIEEAAVTASKQ